VAWQVTGARANLQAGPRARRQRAAAPDNVLTYGMGLQPEPLQHAVKQINKNTVKRLGAGVEHFARQQLWRTGAAARLRRHYVRGQCRIHGCHRRRHGQAALAHAGRLGPGDARAWCAAVFSNKGPAVYNGKVYRGTLDAHVGGALDQKTGKQIWKTKIAEWKEGFSITSAPMVANGCVDHRHFGRRVRYPRFFSTASIRKPESSCGAFTPYPRPAKRAAKTWPAGDA